MEILIKRLHEEAKLPVYEHETGAGLSLYSAEEVTIEPGEKTIVKTGVALAIPVGYIGLVWDKDRTITCPDFKTTVQIVESGYRGEIKVGLWNRSSEARTFQVGDKVAQMLIQKIEHPSLIEAEDLSETEGGLQTEPIC